MAALAWMLALAGARPARAADEGAGTRAAGFLSAGAGVSALGMGGATLALGRDLSATPWNAAALAGLDAPQAVFAHAAFADQTSQDWAAYGNRWGGSATRWVVAGLYRDEGTITGRDALDQPTADFEARSVALTGEIARPFGEWLSAGAGAEYVGEHLQGVHGNGLAFDAGVQARARGFGLAIAAQHFGGGMRWAGERWRMPASLGMGAAWETPAGLRIAADWNAPADYYRDVRVGAEWRWRGRLALRAGYRRELGAPADDRLNGPAFGAGFDRGALGLDYAYGVDGAGQSTQRFALRWSPGRAAVPASGRARAARVPHPEAAPPDRHTD